MTIKLSDVERIATDAIKNGFSATLLINGQYYEISPERAGGCICNCDKCPAPCMPFC